MRQGSCVEVRDLLPKSSLQALPAPDDARSSEQDGLGLDSSYKHTYHVSITGLVFTAQYTFGNAILILTRARWAEGAHTAHACRAFDV